MFHMVWIRVRGIEAIAVQTYLGLGFGEEGLTTVKDSAILGRHSMSADATPNRPSKSVVRWGKLGCNWVATGEEPEARRCGPNVSGICQILFPPFQMPPKEVYMSEETYMQPLCRNKPYM